MRTIRYPHNNSPLTTRRQFVTGLASCGTLWSLGLRSEPDNSATNQSRTGPHTLTGKHFKLLCQPLPVNFTGKPRYATAINGSVPAPILRWKEGERVTISVSNQLAEDTSVHWHGLILPSSQDGVPHISEGFKGIRPGDNS